VAAAYQPGPTDPHTADDSVARLAELLPGGPDEQVAARIGLLIQAYDATAGLIGNAVVAGIRAGRPVPPAELVAQALRTDPLLARCRWTGAAIGYQEPSALRTPERLELTER
jgi:hypothetical protein